jgi:hypothetical protein
VSELVIDLAAAHLKRQLLFQTQRGRFGSREAVQELAISARGCAGATVAGPRLMVAFVLERVLDQWGKHLGGRLVSLSETAHLSGRMQQPVARAVDFLTGGADDPVEIAAALIKARPSRER